MTTPTMDKLSEDLNTGDPDKKKFSLSRANFDIKWSIVEFDY